jgi:hypothetical protein
MIRNDVHWRAFVNTVMVLRGLYKQLNQDSIIHYTELLCNPLMGRAFDACFASVALVC